jgi:U3 small nucleolar RNA-associated protein MPP10
VHGVEGASLVKQQHEEISLLFDKICFSLDALAQFHYTPKPEDTQVAIKANIPAMMMEEQLPMIVSDTTLLAPHEIQKAPLTIKSNDEYTPEERKALRRRIKTKHQKRDQEKKSKKPVDTKAEALKTLKSSNQVIMEKGKKQDRPNLSSKAFFSKLQAEAESGSYSKQKKRNTTTKNNNAASFKL